MDGTLVPLQKYKKINQIVKKYTCSVNASSVSWTSTLKLNITVYDKLLCKKQGSINSVCMMISYPWAGDVKV